MGLHSPIPLSGEGDPLSEVGEWPTLTDITHTDG